MYRNETIRQAIKFGDLDQKDKFDRAIIALVENGTLDVCLTPYK